MPSFFEIDAVERLVRQLKIDPQVLRRARTAFFKQGADATDALQLFPIEKRDAFAASVAFGSVEEPRRFDSGTNEATKLVYRTSEGYSYESVVLRPATGRTALCISSQVGCAAACRFCATGQMGIAKHLSSDAILDQVAAANRLLRQEDRRVRNIVFMGMGEPMHNVAAVRQALRVLQDPAAFDHPASRILVSTVGVPEPLIDTAEEFPTTNFALSLHAARQSVRERLIPLARSYSLALLRETVAHLNSIQPKKTSVMIEYLMLDGVNDQDADLSALLDWLSGLRVHVNLIPYNTVPGVADLGVSSREVIEGFGASLRCAGYPTTIRYSLGSDIEAACGQLVRRENRLIASQLAASKAL